MAFDSPSATAQLRISRDAECAEELAMDAQRRSRMSGNSRDTRG